MTGKITVSSLKFPRKPNTAYIPICNKYGQSRVALANPYAENLYRSREEASLMYEDYLMEKLNQGSPMHVNTLTEMVEILQSGTHIILTCNCEHEACHGHFIKEVVEDVITHKVI